MRISSAARIGIALLLAANAGANTAAPAIELQAGRSYTAGRGTPTAFADGLFAERAIGSTRLTWAPQLSAGWIDHRAPGRHRHSGHATADSIWLVAAGARFRLGAVGDWYHRLFFSFQPALHTGRTQALGSVYEFASTLGWQGRRFSIQVRHISNGSLQQPNGGETMLLMGVRLVP